MYICRTLAGNVITPRKQNLLQNDFLIPTHLKLAQNCDILRVKKHIIKLEAI